MTRWLSWHRRLTGPAPLGWTERLLLALLIPAGWLYGVAGLIRHRLYRLQLLSSYRAPVPVISVGNLAAGGTGKTPTVDYVLKFLLAQGRNVAVVSRGYGGRGVPGGIGVVSDGAGPLLAPEQCGDEPYLLALRNPQAKVVVAPRRREGVRLAVERLGAEVVLLDDGFQHLAVARDLDIVLLDGERPLGNGHVLPAGILREFPTALQRGHLFVLTRSADKKPALPPLPGPVLHSRHQLAGAAVDLHGQVVPLTELVGRRGVAFAGIADPERFFASLRSAGVEPVATLGFPDHAAYDQRLLARLHSAATGADYLITTEKDAVKLRPGEFSIPCYRVPLELALQEAGKLEEILQTVLAKRGTHGHFPRTA
ncbi:MAG: tetraacyldisaccharide 4'-kinase [Desulfuromonadales bacterium]|nr:tetraacyldisaccharide 4'-kinase [Desulfuromonadales bacterium]